MEIASAPTEAAFVGRRQRDWDHLDALVRGVSDRGLRSLPSDRIARFGPLYCDVCADLAHAQAARYSAPLVDYLQALTAGAHGVLYAGQAKSGGARARGSSVRLALDLFPRAVRRHKVAMTVAFLLFFVPFLGGLVAATLDPSFAARIVPESQLRPLADAYRQGFASGRGNGMDAAMAGFYVDNNVGIALRCFATGLFFGIGSAFYLVENGLATGAIMGYVAARGAGDNILTFVVGHGSLELGAIGLAGGAGLALGWSLVAPGSRTRIASLQAAARSVIIVVFGAAVMLFMAATIEGFWSASSLPSVVKRAVGAVTFVIVTVYILIGGRGSAEAERVERNDGARWT
jgi:uncharacterized membrane protein SpoIIM required for sporulation